MKKLLINMNTKRAKMLIAVIIALALTVSPLLNILPNVFALDMLDEVSYDATQVVNEETGYVTVHFTAAAAKPDTRIDSITLPDGTVVLGNYAEYLSTKNDSYEFLINFTSTELIAAPVAPVVPPTPELPTTPDAPVAPPTIPAAPDAPIAPPTIPEVPATPETPIAEDSILPVVFAAELGSTETAPAVQAVESTKTKTVKIDVFGVKTTKSRRSISAIGAGDVEINSTNFPDEFFNKYVKKFDTNADGTLQVAELEAVTSITADGGQYPLYCKSIIGIEYFTELIEFKTSAFSLLEVDLSKNTKLESAYFDYPYLLEKVNLTGNKKLKKLHVYTEYLRSLDISQNTELTSFFFSQVSTFITELDLSKNTALTDVTFD